MSQRLPLSLFSQSLLPLLRSMVSFPTDERFSPVGRWFSRNSGCQDVAVLLKYGCGVRFGFCCYFSAALSLCSFAIIGDFLVGYVPLLALVFLSLQFPVVVFVIFTAATYPTTSLRRLALSARSFATNWKDQLVLGSSLASNTAKHTWMWPIVLSIHSFK